MSDTWSGHLSDLILLSFKTDVMPQHVTLYGHVSASFNVDPDADQFRITFPADPCSLTAATATLSRAAVAAAGQQFEANGRDMTPFLRLMWPTVETWTLLPHHIATDPPADPAT